MEKNTTEHVHEMGQRTFEDRFEAHRQFGDGLERRIAADHPHRGAVGQTAAQTQQEAVVQVAETRKCVRRPQVPAGRRGH